MFNGEAYLEETILSVANQTYRNIEYIVVDGGSTDGTLEIIKRRQDKIDRWISEKDSGMYEAVNKGLKMASGEILAYLNSDDIYRPNAVQEAVDFFNRNPEASIMYGNADFLDGSGRLLYSYRFPEFRWRLYVSMNWSSVPQPASFWRRGVHEKAGYFDESFRLLGDFDFFAKAGSLFRVGHVGSPLAGFRLHQGALTRAYPREGKRELDLIHGRYGGKSRILNSLLRRLGEARVKLANLPLMAKKLLGILRTHGA